MKQPPEHKRLIEALTIHSGHVPELPCVIRTEGSERSMKNKVAPCVVTQMLTCRTWLLVEEKMQAEYKRIRETLVKYADKRITPPRIIHTEGTERKLWYGIAPCIKARVDNGELWLLTEEPTK